MQQDAPTVSEIARLTQQELTTPDAHDSLRECGRAVLSLLSSDPDLCLKFAYQKLHDVSYKQVMTCWRRLHVDASLWKAVRLTEGEYLEDVPGKAHNNRLENLDASEDVVGELVKLLDTTLILAGAPKREELVELWFSALKTTLLFHDKEDERLECSASHRPAKRRRLYPPSPMSHIPPKFPSNLPELVFPKLHSIPREKNISLSTFQNRLVDSRQHKPVIIEGAVDHWPALGERPWSNPRYLLEQTLGGRRLVPVEIGKSYTEEGWEQKIITFKEFLETHMFPTPLPHGAEEIDTIAKSSQADSGTDATGTKASQWTNPEKVSRTGYLAQHDLFAQIPSLRADISIPDYCYCDPAPNPHLTHIKAMPKLEEPLLNAWFGPAGTISPLHTDPYHNILVQIVGYKYVRLYAPDETLRLYPRSIDEHGVDMSNTSQVDLDEAMAVWPKISCRGTDDENGKERFNDRRRELENYYPGFKEAKYVEGVLGPGECLYLPVGWWHYVRSLTPSFSVSFWFN